MVSCRLVRPSIYPPSTLERAPDPYADELCPRFSPDRRPSRLPLASTLRSSAASRVRDAPGSNHRWTGLSGYFSSGSRASVPCTPSSADRDLIPTHISCKPRRNRKSMQRGCTRRWTSTRGRRAGFATSDAPCTGRDYGAGPTISHALAGDSRAMPRRPPKIEVVAGCEVDALLEVFV